jgi:hypothetical protein
MTCLRLIVLVAALLATTRAELLAQQRSGLMIGLSVGGGATDVSGTSANPNTNVALVEGSHASGALGFYIGGHVNPRLALMFDAAYGEGTSDSGVDGELRVGLRRLLFRSASSAQDVYVFSGAVQYWPSSRIWLKGGLGAGYLDRSVETEDLTISIESGAGFAALGGAGVDVWKRNHFTMDVQFRFTTIGLEGIRINTPTAQVGFTWHGERQ